MPITMAIGNRYDTKYFLQGVEQVEGFDIEYVDAGPAPAPIFNAMVTTLPYDIGEQAMSNYVIAFDLGVPLTAIPVFPSRFFPQFGILVSTKSNIDSPADLQGKRVGVLNGFAFNPAVWLRGIFAHHYDVSPESMTWVEGERDSLAGVDYPRSPRYTIEKKAELQKLLDAGEIDAYIGPGGGISTAAGTGPPPTTKKLFEDPYGESKAYFDASGVFPLNTVITVKREVAEAHPELGDAVLQASRRARKRYHDEIGTSSTDHMGLDTQRLQQLQLFPDAYGLNANRASIRAMVSYLHEQGLIKTRYEPEDLFMECQSD